MKYTWILILLFFPLSLLAQGDSVGGGSGVGNGGDVIYCEATQTYQLLDYWEAQELFGRTVYLGEDHLDHKKLVVNVLKRLWSIDPERSERYLKRFESFFTIARFLNEGELRDIQDSSEIALPAGCVLKQAIIQLRPENALYYKFIIDRKIWDQLSEVDKAGLVLHELIYEEALSLAIPHTNSISTRVLNGLISSRSFESDYHHEIISYFELLQKMRFPISLLKFSDFCVADPRLNMDLTSRDRIRFRHLTQAGQSDYCPKGSSLRYEGQSIFVKSGEIRLGLKNFSPVVLHLASGHQRLYLPQKGSFLIEDKIHFHHNGRVSLVHTRGLSSLKLQDMRCHFGMENKLSTLSFWLNGNIKHGHLTHDTVLQKSDLSIKNVRAGERFFTVDEFAL